MFSAFSVNSFTLVVAGGNCTTVSPTSANKPNASPLRFAAGFKNPLAFLKVGENMVLGVGQIETHLGRSYFVKNKPIDFVIARFRFVPMDCEKK